MTAARTDTGLRIAREHMSSTERALAESIERYRSLFAYSPHAAFSLDLEGNFIDANLVSAEVSGYSPEEFLQMNFPDVIAPKHLPVSIAAFEGALHRAPQQIEANM